MNRVTVLYDGVEYPVPGNSADDVRRRIEEALSSGGPGWLRVIFGHGRGSDTDLLIMPGVPIAVVEHQLDQDQDT